MLYEAECTECDNVFDYVRSVDQRHDVPDCPRCQGLAVKTIRTGPATATSSFAPYRSPVDGTIIASKRDLEAHNKRNNVALLNDGYSEETIRAGDIKRKATTLDKNELAADLAQAKAMVESGYKPQVQTHE